MQASCSGIARPGDIYRRKHELSEPLLPTSSQRHPGGERDRSGAHMSRLVKQSNPPVCSFSRRIRRQGWQRLPNPSAKVAAVAFFRNHTSSPLAFLCHVNQFVSEQPRCLYYHTRISGAHAQVNHYHHRLANEASSTYDVKAGCRMAFVYFRHEKGLVRLTSDTDPVDCP